MIRKRILNFTPYNQAYIIEALLINLVKKNETVNKESHEGYWLDIEKPDDKAIECKQKFS